MGGWGLSQGEGVRKPSGGCRFPAAFFQFYFISNKADILIPKQWPDPTSQLVLNPEEGDLICFPPTPKPWPTNQESLRSRSKDQALETLRSIQREGCFRCGRQMCQHLSKHLSSRSSTALGHTAVQ